MAGFASDRILFLFTCVLAVLLFAEQSRADDSVDEILSRLAATYADVPSVEADFVQTSTGMSYVEPFVQSGQLAFERPARMRWEFTSPSRQQYLSDGSTLWVVEEKDRTCHVFRQLDSTLALYFDFLTGMANVKSHFQVSLGPVAEGKHILELRPTARDSSFGTVSVHIDRATGLVSGMDNITPFGDRTEVRLSAIQTGNDIPDERFVWAPREGYKVIEEP